MKIRNGDTVKILYGKDAGTTGKVVRTMRKSEMVVVDGKNLFKRHLKGDGQSRKSEIVSIPKPLHISKVQLVDADGVPTRIGYRVENGKKVRFSKRSGKTFDVVKAPSKAKAKTEEKKETTKEAKVVKKKSK